MTIPKEVLWALDLMADERSDVSMQAKHTIYKFLKTSDKYIKDLEQYIDDLVASQHGVAEDD